jgi:hypothetical protein
MRTPSIGELAESFHKFLKEDRLAKRHSPEYGVKMEKLLIIFQSVPYEFKVTDRMIRLATNMLRKSKIPIGGGQNGYYYVLKSYEWKFTKQRLLPAWIDMKIILNSISAMENEMKAIEDGIKLKEVEQIEIFAGVEQ